MSISRAKGLKLQSRHFVHIVLICFLSHPHPPKKIMHILNVIELRNPVIDFLSFFLFFLFFFFFCELGTNVCIRSATPFSELAGHSHIFGCRLTAKNCGCIINVILSVSVRALGSVCSCT